MDPTECYLSMYRAMRDKDYAAAREHAEDLQEWLRRGGFYPPNYSQTEIDGYLANVLRRTVGQFCIPTASALPSFAARRGAV